MLTEGTGAGVREMCSTEGWVQCSGVKEEGFGEESRVEGNGGHG
jgi:hypothetical protein